MRCFYQQPPVDIFCLAVTCQKTGEQTFHLIKRINFGKRSETKVCVKGELQVTLEISPELWHNRDSHATWMASGQININPKEFPQYEGLVQLLLHFQWNWVGLMASDSEYGEHFLSFLVPMLKKKEICLAFTEIFKSEEIIVTVRSFIRIFTHWFKVEVIVLFGDSNSIENVPVALNVYQEFQKTTFQKVWILTSLWKLSEMEYEETSKIVKQFHGALHLRDLTRDFLEFTHFLLTLDPFNPQGDIFLPLCIVFDLISKNNKMPSNVLMIHHGLPEKSGRLLLVSGQATLNPQCVLQSGNDPSLSKGGLSQPKDSSGEISSVTCNSPFTQTLVSDLGEKVRRMALFRLLLLFWLLPPTSVQGKQSVCVLTNPFQTPEQLDYYRSGDFIIGGNLNLQTFAAFNFQGYEESLFSRVFGKEITSVVRRDNPLDLVEGLFSCLLTCHSQAKYVNWWLFLRKEEAHSRSVYPSFFRINPDEFPQYVGLVQLLLHFQWNWVGLVAPEDDDGERFISSLVPMLKEKEICLAFCNLFISDNIAKEKLEPDLFSTNHTGSPRRLIDLSVGNPAISCLAILSVGGAERTARNPQIAALTPSCMKLGQERSPDNRHSWGWQCGGRQKKHHSPGMAEPKQRRRWGSFYVSCLHGSWIDSSLLSPHIVV
ncbi:hypothetical protein E2320_022216 [Naja naja]|nr:hypothetical protein E2320_022216 [Naja naja]